MTRGTTRDRMKVAESSYSGEGSRGSQEPMTKLLIGTYNANSLAYEKSVLELDQQLQTVGWDIIGLSEVKRTGEARITLHSGHTLFYSCKKDNTKREVMGVGVIINKRIAPNIIKYKKVSDRIVYLVITISSKYTLQVIVAYAPTQCYVNPNVFKKFYKDLEKAISDSESSATLVIGDFNAILGKHTPCQWVGQYGIGNRDKAGEKLALFLKKNRLYAMNSFVNTSESLELRWTYKSFTGRKTDERDYILSDTKEIVTSVWVEQHFNASSDHRLVMAEVVVPKMESVEFTPIRTINRYNLNELSIRKEDYQRKVIELLRDQAEVGEEKIMEMLKYQGEVDHQGAKELLKHQSEADSVKLLIKITHAIITAAKEVLGEQKNVLFKVSEETRGLQEHRRNHLGNTKVYKDICDEARNCILKDAKTFTREMVLRAVKENTELDYFRENIELHKIVENGEDVIEQNQHLIVLEDFYRCFYSTKIEPPHGNHKDNVGKLGHQRKNLPVISDHDIKTALEQIKVNETPGIDGIPFELLQAGGDELLSKIKDLFNNFLKNGSIPMQWQNSVATMKYQNNMMKGKGNIKKSIKQDNIEVQERQKICNYKLTHNMPHMYELFINIITNKLTVEQTGFRTNYRKIDHIHIIRQIIEKSKGSQEHLYMAFLKFDKAFDTVEIWALLRALNRCNLHENYTKLITNIYRNTTMTVEIASGRTKKIKLCRGIRPDDNLARKLYTNLLEDVFENLKWHTQGIQIEERYLSHLQYDDEVVIFSKSATCLQKMIHELWNKCRGVGLEIDFLSSALMTNSTLTAKIKINNTVLKTVTKHTYLGQIMDIKNDIMDEIKHRIKEAEASFNSLDIIFDSDFPYDELKKQMFVECVLPKMIFGCETWPLTITVLKKLKTVQRAMEKKMLGIKSSNPIKDVILREMSGIEDIVETVARLKVLWAGDIGNSADERWTRIVTEWEGLTTTKKGGKRKTRWSDDIEDVAGQDWITRTSSLTEWKDIQEKFVEYWKV